jgi:hypothetical protein
VRHDIAVLIHQEDECPLDGDRVEDHGRNAVEDLRQRLPSDELARDFRQQQQQPFGMRSRLHSGSRFRVVVYSSNDRAIRFDERVLIAKDRRGGMIELDPQRKSAEHDRIAGMDLRLRDLFAVQEGAVSTTEVGEDAAIAVDAKARVTP